MGQNQPPAQANHGYWVQLGNIVGIWEYPPTNGSLLHRREAA